MKYFWLKYVLEFNRLVEWWHHEGHYFISILSMQNILDIQWHLLIVDYILRICLLWTFFLILENRETMDNRVGPKANGERYRKSPIMKIIVYVCKELPSCLDTYNSGTRGMYDQYRSSILNWFQDITLNCIWFMKCNECLFANHQLSLIQGFT